MDKLMYHEGFKYAFNPKACQACEGKCCIGESGYIWVSQEEINRIAEKLLLTKEHFINNYLLKIRYRFTIKEIAYEGGYGCIFFDRAKKICTIYDVRPSQCRTFPFWEYFKENIDEVVSECPGIIRL
jgi:uncharacterized protein